MISSESAAHVSSIYRQRVFHLFRKELKRMKSPRRSLYDARSCEMKGRTSQRRFPLPCYCAIETQEFFMVTQMVDVSIPLRIIAFSNITSFRVILFIDQGFLNLPYSVL